MTGHRPMTWPRDAKAPFPPWVYDQTEITPYFTTIANLSRINSSLFLVLNSDMLKSLKKMVLTCLVMLVV